ncbi:hypothetical protein CC78DRAFT_535026, partial [Lojkania enalia]
MPLGVPDLRISATLSSIGFNVMGLRYRVWFKATGSLACGRLNLCFVDGELLRRLGFEELDRRAEAKRVELTVIVQGLLVDAGETNGASISSKRVWSTQTHVRMIEALSSWHYMYCGAFSEDDGCPGCPLYSVMVQRMWWLVMIMVRSGLVRGLVVGYEM